MKKETFSKLLTKLRPMLQKKNTNFRKCVSPEEKRSNNTEVFCNRLQSKGTIITLDLPDPSPLPGQDTNFPFYFAADEAFPLMCTIMKPYPKRGLTNRKRVFNGRLSRGRKSVECSFGMMSSKFRILHTTIGLNINTVDNIVKAVCLLHNFIKKEEGIFSRPRGKKGNDDDIEVENEEQPYPRLSNQRRATNPAIATREKLCDFFLTVDGSLKGQKRFCVKTRR
ncbi:unnamed protein product [Acanthoscelides obtectus]|uniref:DDE Tnp4 domain-containing protein n=1 Tax=Acanthoscelides obtectus TaxID=200917 RepID=A0A9P0PPV3_ACAOB|nr:unnamed protein product [Acanthoscelides obtectus]CAK1624888.1 hypothetical protein AOBTE_LOCUS2827 [Acanthoscelides obtectus]